MDSNINLLPEKDKQLKREGQRKPSAEMVEMTKPQDRVFQERVVRMEGLLAFFKNIFRRAPKLPQPKTKEITPPAPPKPVSVPSKPAAPVTKLETMMDRMTSVPQAPKPVHEVTQRVAGGSSTLPPAGTFLSKLFNKPNRPSPLASSPPPLAVPPPSRLPAVTKSAPATTPRASAWAPPPPSVLTNNKPQANVPLSAPSLVAKPTLPPPPPPPLPGRSRVPASSSTTEVQPMLGASLNVNLVPEQYQPEASVKDRILAVSFVGGAVLIIVAATVSLYFYQKQLQNKVQAVDQQILQVNQEIASREREDLSDALVLQQRTNDVKRVLDQHVYWDAFFQKLEGITLPSVAYSSMSVDVGGSVTLVAQAQSYNDVGAQLLTYQRAKDFITDVTISSASQTSSSTPGSTPPGQTAQQTRSLVSFSVSMRVNPIIFYRR